MAIVMHLHAIGQKIEGHLSVIYHIIALRQYLVADDSKLRIELYDTPWNVYDDVLGDRVSVCPEIVYDSFRVFRHWQQGIAHVCLVESHYCHYCR